VSSHAGVEHLGAHDREAIDNVRLGFWIFLGSESVFFATLIGTYLALHTHGGHGQDAHVLDIAKTTVATIALSFSGLTMALAVAAARRHRPRAMANWLIATILLGLVFVANQVLEFTSLYRDGVTLKSSAFGSSFFVLTGFHGLHVTFGCVWMIIWLVHIYQGHYFPDDSDSRRRIGDREAAMFEVCGLYWAFVDVVWIVIFTVVYLIGALS
jgi:heme/copper-type cytochrome/quinol oxidase subunit 3